MLNTYTPSPEDITWAEHFKALYSFAESCQNADDILLRLSTCRNAYMTANALFVELQILMGDAAEPSALWGGSEMLMQASNSVKTKEQFDRALQTVGHYEHKKRVWNERDKIGDDIDKAIGLLRTKDLLAADRVKSILNNDNLRIPSDAASDVHANTVLLIDKDDPPHLASCFQDLDDTFDVLRCCAKLGRYVAITAVGTEQLALNFDDEPTKVTPETAAKRVFELVENLHKLCGWGIRTKDDSIIIDIIGDYARPHYFNTTKMVEIPTAKSIESVHHSMSKFGVLIREALYFSHAQLCLKFRPNVGKLPMPSLFVIDLNRVSPDQKKETIQEIKLKRINCSAQPTTNDTIRVAIAEFAFPAQKMDLKEYRIQARYLDKSIEEIRTAVIAAHENGCNCIAFPEYSIPEKMEKVLMELAEKYCTIIIGGLEGRRIDGQLCDQAIIALPGGEKPYYQRKQQPSLEEETGDGFYRDNTISFFQNSQIGNFSVVLCSDFLQLSTLRVWESDLPLPEVLFVVARNTYDELYIDIAKGDSVRLYTNVIIANVCDDNESASCKGSCVVVPARESMLAKGTQVKFAPENHSYLGAITYYDISLHAVRARSRGKSEKGYFAIPAAARRFN